MGSTQFWEAIVVVADSMMLTCRNYARVHMAEAPYYIGAILRMLIFRFAPNRYALHLFSTLTRANFRMILLACGKKVLLGFMGTR